MRTEIKPRFLRFALHGLLIKAPSAFGRLNIDFEGLFSTDFLTVVD